MSRLLNALAVGAMLAFSHASHAQSLNLADEPLGIDLAGSRCVFTVKTLPLTGENPDKRALAALRELAEQPKVVGASFGVATGFGSAALPQDFAEAMMVVLANMRQAEVRPDPFGGLQGAVQVATGEPEYQGKHLQIVQGLPAFGAIAELNTPDASYNRLCN